MRWFLHFFGRILTAFAGSASTVYLLAGQESALSPWEGIGLSPRLIPGVALLSGVGTLLCVREQSVRLGAGLLSFFWMMRLGLEPGIGTLSLGGLALILAILPLPQRRRTPRETEKIAVPVEGMVRIRKGPERPKAALKLPKAAWWDEKESS